MPNGKFRKNVVIFGVNSIFFSVHANNDKKRYLCIKMRAAAFSMIMVSAFINSKAEVSEVKVYLLCLSNISNGFTVDDMQKNRLNEYVYHFGISDFEEA